MPRYRDNERKKIILRLYAAHGPLRTFMQRYYHDEMHSLRELRALFAVGPTTLDWLFEFFGVRKRTIAEGIAMQYVRDPARREISRAIGRTYLAPCQPIIPKGATKETCPTVAKIMQTRLERYGHAQPYLRGRRNGNFCGGGPKWWKTAQWLDVRERAKRRDGFKCQECGMTEAQCIAEFDQPLQVHHVVPYRVCQKHELHNLRTLCPRCHTTVDRTEGVFAYQQELRTGKPVQQLKLVALCA